MPPRNRFFRIFIFVLIASCPAFPETLQNLNQTAQKISKIRPGIFSMWISGIKTHLKTQDRIIALTFDACGGKHGSGLNKKLLLFLEKERIPATLFMSGTWIDANLETFKKLSENPLFEIENHGTYHKPCSANGKSAYRIKGTSSIKEMLEEIENNALKIQFLTGKRPKFYRSGTAHYDRVCVSALKELGYEGVNFTVISDDATRSNSIEKIKRNILKVKSGGIILMHINQPRFKTYEAFKLAYPVLKKRGYSFVHLRDYDLLQ